MCDDHDRHRAVKLLDRFEDSNLIVRIERTRRLVENQDGGAPQQRAALLAMVSTASIPLPDPVEYRRDWRSYRVHLSFGDGPGEVETREVDAPEPPPGG